MPWSKVIVSDERYRKAPELERQYLSFNGFNRPALIMGVPLMLLLPLLMVTMLSTFTLVHFFGLVGGIPILIAGIIIFLVRILTENDPNALAVLKCRLKGVVVRKGKSTIAIRG
ncbi:VirB3 family type IV secretion system protein [Arsenophonus nasoniae]|uniref:VirB3 family type IV secretion system protein n=1 Tax=Arsenophonus nasoniae TaxID=638 RepID=A0AA95KFI6_9GAMM|nr:VirB3 family type IV secretion system protein [Arsenophonus nasoniae]WGM03939.1 VirB3 family type IV secretion system protein [Arsenophonus nasoniae]WGM09136.1 VirB3 family type IV secretion system protein [Arsenophonus nasoniae]